MTDPQWLNAPQGIGDDDADAQSDAIERATGINDPDAPSDTRGIVRSLFTGILLPVILVCIVLLALFWLVIEKFNLLML